MLGRMMEVPLLVSSLIEHGGNSSEPDEGTARVGRVAARVTDCGHCGLPGQVRSFVSCSTSMRSGPTAAMARPLLGVALRWPLGTASSATVFTRT